MTIEEKSQLYETYLSDRARTIEVPLKGGPKITYLKCWDYKATLKEITFKSLHDLPLEHSSVKIEEVDLMPIANFKYYQITVTR